ncbi:PAS domain-containing protein [Pseudopelagicola sp. nBUS_19]|uniref:PAS domain-containing protein n=1 Tax=Pseudopelagicola sp. nBUS_19 TaxID=3395316 RepID=UPI003EBB6C6E
MKVISGFWSTFFQLTHVARPPSSEEMLEAETLELSSTFNKLIEDSDAFTFGVNANGYVFAWNETAEQLTGIRRRDVIGQNLFSGDVLDGCEETVSELFDKIFAGEKVGSFHISLQSKSADRINVLSNATALRTANGKIIGVFTIGNEVTELTWEQTELSRVNNNLKQMIDTANAPIFGIDSDGNVNEWNQTAERITGFTKQEVLGQDLAACLIVEEHEERVADILRKALAGIEVANFSLPLKSKAGDHVDVLFNLSSQNHQNGQVCCVVGVGQDTTELNAEKAKYEQIANDLKMLIDTANAPIFGIDSDGNVNEWNQTAERITGFTKQEVLGQDLVSLYITDDYKDSVSLVLNKALAGEQTANYEFPLFTKVGSHVDVLLNSTTRRNANGEIIGVVGVGQDITELNAEKAKYEQIANDLTKLIDTANAPIFGIDSDGNVNEWNQTAERITGFTKQEVLGQDLVSLYITDDYKDSVSLVLNKALAGEQTANYKFPLFTKVGSHVDVLLNSTTRRNANGEIIGVVGVGQDITELNAEKAKYEQIANDLTKLIDTANAPIFGIDSDGNVNEWNQTAERITGFTKQEVLGQDLVSLYITDDYKDSVSLVLNKALAGEQTANYEFPLFTKVGSHVDVLLNSTTRRNANGEIIGVVGVGQDITELKRSLAEVVHTSKLATIGELATSIAHELNQPLNVIRLAAGNCRMRLDTEENYLDAKLERIETQTERAAKIIDHMRTFGRKSHGISNSLRVCEVIRHTLEFIKDQLALANIDTHTNFACQKSVGVCKTCVVGDMFALEQVLLNLFTNAKHAMETQNLDSPREILIDTSKEDGCVQINIRDTGEGLADNIRDKIFEPFFTTKDIGKGTGLGLSVSHSIIRDMGGSMGCSNWDRGACFTIKLPFQHLQGAK